MVLKRVERWLSRLIEGDDLAVNYGVVGKSFEGLTYSRVTRSEIVVIPRAQIKLAVRLERYGSIAIKLQFVLPLSAFGQMLLSEKQHGLDETSLVQAAFRGLLLATRVEAHRRFWASDIFLRAAADIFQRSLTLPLFGSVTARVAFIPATSRRATNALLIAPCSRSS
jgi:hypothetical protein